MNYARDWYSLRASHEILSSTQFPTIQAILSIGEKCLVVAGGRKWRVQREQRVRDSGSFVTRRRYGNVTSSLERGKLFSGKGFDREFMIGCCCNRRRMKIKSHLNPYTVCCVSYLPLWNNKKRFASDPDSTFAGLVPRSNHVCRYCTSIWDTLSTGSLACRVLQYHASKGIHSSCVWWVTA